MPWTVCSYHATHTFQSSVMEQYRSIIWPVWLNGRVFLYKLSGSGFKFRCLHLNFRSHVCFEQNTKGIYRVPFTLKRAHDMITTCSQKHYADKYPQHSSVIWPVSLNGWVFVCKLSGCGFESTSGCGFYFWATLGCRLTLKRVRYIIRTSTASFFSDFKS